MNQVESFVGYADWACGNGVWEWQNEELKSKNSLSSCLDELVRQVNRSARRTVYTYTGDVNHHPIYYEETLLFKKMIDALGLTCRVVEVSDDAFHPSQWDPKSSIVHIPGAISAQLDAHLGAKVAEIKAFVENGGGFLGWCGGGYWASRRVCYQMDDHSRLERIRELALWKGVQEGPLLPYLGNPEGNIGFFHGVVSIKWEGSEVLKKHFPQGLEVQALISGGGYFIPDPEEYRYKVLGRYIGQPPAKQRAAVKTEVDQGVAVLVNPYFTHGDDYLEPGLTAYQTHFPSHPWEQIVHSLRGAERALERRIAFADLFVELARSPSAGPTSDVHERWAWTPWKSSFQLLADMNEDDLAKI